MSRRGRRGAIALAALASAMLALGVVRSRRAVRVAAERFPPVGEFVDVDGARIHLLRRGAGEALPLVLIHGADGVLQSFSETVLDRLAEETLAIAVDRPGHGWSVAPSRVRRDLALNVRLLRDAVRELGYERAVLVGQSYGCAVALRWALDHPDDVAGLVLLSPAAYPAWLRITPVVMAAPAIPVLGPALSEALLPWLGPPVLARAERRFGFGPNPVPDIYAEYARSFFLRPTQFAALAEEYRYIRRDLGEMAGRYGEIHVPTLIVSGAEDPLTRPSVQAERLAREIPGAQLELVPGVGHQMLWYAQEQVIEAVREVREAASAGGA